ncbi:MAG: TolC family protein [Sphaerochaeta sp.]|uniref:TolC family protein n=1 Tax=Sphaerochaeta sp. TaxID=1972642 RepID=UPI002FCA038A
MRTLCIGIVVAGLLASPLYCQSLSLEQAWQSAQANHTTARNANLTLAKQLNQAQTNDYLPSLSLSVGASASASILGDSYRASLNPSIGISFSLSSSDRFSKAEKDLLVQTAQTSYHATLQGLQSEVTTAYWNVVAASLAKQAQQLDVQQQTQTLSSIQEAYDGGKASSLAVSQAKLTLSSANLKLQERTQALENATQNLESYVGYPVDGTSDSLLAVQKLKPEEALISLAAKTSTIGNLELKVRDAQLALQTQQAKSISPNLNISASTSLGATLATDSSLLKDSTSLSMTVSLPLDAYLPDSSAQTTLENLDADIQIAQNNLSAGMQKLQFQVKQAYQSISQAAENLQYLKQNQALAEETYSLTRASYEAGESTYLTLQESENQRTSTALAILQQQLTYTLALYDLSALLEVDIQTLFAH